jgi:microcystin-dependent protein
MLKKLLIGLAILAGLSGPVYGAGTIPGFSLTPQIGSNGVPLVGCKLYIIQAGTTSTPQNGYSDSGLTLPLPNPVICDGYGRLPQIFVADGNIKVRLTTAGGAPITTIDGILVIGASSGGGGGSPVDATTILATGDWKLRYGVGNLTGFVRGNGKTIGSASSGATERANADCQALFEYLWSADASLTVSTGRGASANADWVANKQLTLPDLRGRVMAGFDDMGNTAAGRLTTTTMSGIGIGSVGGAETQTLTAAQIPAHSHPNTINDPGHTHSTSNGTQDTVLNGGGGAATVLRFVSSGLVFLNTSTTGITINNANNTGGGGAHPNVQPTMLMTFYIKL